jgi:ABC-type bacteriocin/lantibiotic exporter with double-glycine peptidase domain
MRIIRKLWKVLNGSERRRLVSLLVLDNGIGVVDIASLAGLLFIINFYAAPEKMQRLPSLPHWLLDRNSLMLISCFLFLFLVKSMMGFFILRARYRFIFGVASRLSETNVLRYLEGSYMDYVGTDSAVHIRKISQEPVEFCSYVLAGAQQIASESILIIFSITAIIWFDARLFLLLFLLLLPAVFLLSRVTRRQLRSVRSSIMTSGEKALQHLQETLAGFIESNIYDKNSYFTSRYVRYQRDLNSYLSDLQITQGVPSRLIEVFAVLGLFILIAMNRFMPGSFTSGTFVTLGAFMAAAYKIIPGIVKIANITGQMRTYEFTMDDLSAREPSLETITSPPTALHPVEPIRSLRCKDITFGYDNTRLLRGVDFYLEAGDFLGIRGASGKGKTTLLHILLGFLTQEGGEVLFNEKASDSEGRKRYWKHIAYVKQQPFLLHDSILANITMNVEHYDAERLQRALMISGLDEMIAKTKDGIKNKIVENGKNISGGQRKRIAMARALYKQADLLILDEPFSELDQRSQQRLLDHFQQLSREGMRIILISHNQDSLTRCNKIIALDE